MTARPRARSQRVSPAPYLPVPSIPICVGQPARRRYLVAAGRDEPQRDRRLGVQAGMPYARSRTGGTPVVSIDAELPGGADRERLHGTTQVGDIEGHGQDAAHFLAGGMVLEMGR